MLKTSRGPVSLACILALVVLATSAAAGPVIPSNQLYGFIQSNKTLTYSSPGPIYEVMGDVVVNPGVTLTIEPGVTLFFNPGRDTLQGGAYASLCELDVHGTLVAEGTAASPIRFESAASPSSTWGFIRAQGNGLIVIRHAYISGAATALELYTPRPHLAENLEIVNCTNGISVGTSMATIRRSSISGRGKSAGGQGLTLGSQVAIAAADSTAPMPIAVANFHYGVLAQGGASVSNVVVRDCTYGIQSSGPVTVNYCTVVRCDQGIRCEGLVINSIAAHCGYGVGIHTNTCADFLDSWANGTNFWSLGGSPGIFVASFNPFFLNPSNNDFRLGDGSIFKMWSNSGFEIGAFGPGPGLPTDISRSTWGGLKKRYR